MVIVANSNKKISEIEKNERKKGKNLRKVVWHQIFSRDVVLANFPTSPQSFDENQ